MHCRGGKSAVKRGLYCVCQYNIGRILFYHRLVFFNELQFPEGVHAVLGYRSIKNSTAKAFKKWVTSEVLPSIRKTRQYGISQSGLSLPDFSNPAEAARAWADMYDKAHTLEAKTQEQQKAIETKDKKIEEDKPKVAFADAVTSSSSCCLIGELAKILAQNGYKIGQNRLFEWLRQHHYLGSKGEYYNMPYQKYIEQGIFKLSQKTFSQGVNMKVGVTTVVTTKGQQYFINKFLSNQQTINFE